MIINFRGPSGSGKSTAVRTILSKWYGSGKPHMTVGRKQPLYYRHAPKQGSMPLYVVGHYETPCGGADTIAGQDTIYNLVKLLAERSPIGHVLFEGLIVGTEYKRALALHHSHDFHVFGLNVPVGVCARSVTNRRRMKDPEAPEMDPKKIEAKKRSIDGTMTKLRMHGVDARYVTREEVVQEVGKLLGLVHD